MGLIRISGGRWGGRRIAVPKTGLRPTQERLRTAVFSSLGDAVVGAHVLDLFAGTGAYGLEAFSRGAAFVCWVDDNGEACRILRRNLAELGGGRMPSGAVVIQADATHPRRYASEGPFSLVFADPPYEWSRDPLALPTLAAALAGADALTDDALLVWEQSVRVPPPDAAALGPGWEALRDRVSGDGRWILYRRRRALAWTAFTAPWPARLAPPRRAGPPDTGPDATQ